MTKIQIAAASLALALAAGFAVPAHAEDPYTFDKVFRMADMNKDGMVTRQEFLDAMGKVYDAKMKSMKNDATMVKGDAMTRSGLKEVVADIYKGA
jgi:6-phosphogluconate dehydrogenase